MVTGVKVFIYIVVLAALLTFLPQAWHAWILILNGLVGCFWIIKEANHKRKAVWLALLLMLILVLIVFPRLIAQLKQWIVLAASF
jgi:FtsH-binding integral membrane protein